MWILFIGKVGQFQFFPCVSN